MTIQEAIKDLEENIEYNRQWRFPTEAMKAQVAILEDILLGKITMEEEL